jgi:hypothetical protein
MMLYGLRLCGYIPYAHGLQSSPAEWIILQMTHKRKLANSFVLFGAMNKFSCLILPIIHAYNAGIFWLRSEDVTSVVCPTPVRRHDSDSMPDSGRRMQLWSYARHRLYILTLDALPYSGRRHSFDRISWLRSRITALVDERATCLTTSAVKDFAWPG